MKVNNINTLKRIVKSQKGILAKKYGVTKIGIFGSFAHGDFTPKSDIDILVNLDKRKNIGLLDFVSMENYLSDRLGRKVDLVTKDSLKPYIKKSILDSTVYV